MANPEHLARLSGGIEAWNRWRRDSPEIAPDLYGANLSRTDLSHGNFFGTILTSAHLNNTKLNRAKLSNADLAVANLAGADLSEAKLSRADFTSAHLVGANLRRAECYLTSFSGADLTEANFTDALTGSTIFGNNDLRTTKGLDRVRHFAASTIGLDTIYRSKGNIHESFLRGCGVPDEFIALAKSLTANPIEFYSCFISYSTKDQDFADRLYADLQNKGVRCWFAPDDAKAGEKLHEQIDEAIRLHDKLLLILSTHSMESDWVKTEILKGGERERDQRRVLFPIRLAPFEALRGWKCFDGDTGRDLAREIREYFIPDFSDWKDHDSYQRALQTLLRDLKSQGSKPK